MIEVIQEPDMPSRMEQEHCCFCAQKTPFWSAKKDVAVCKLCSTVRDEEEVPTKAEWCASPQAKGMLPDPLASVQSFTALTASDRWKSSRD